MQDLEKLFITASPDLDINKPWFAGDQSTCFSAIGSERLLWEINPNMKLLIMLRDPVQRGYSFFHRVHVHENPKGLQIEEAIELDDLRIRHARGDVLDLDELMSHPYRGQVFGYGLYIDHLERWLEYFPMEQILIIDNRDLTVDPQGVIDSVTDFVGIPREEIDGMKDAGKLSDKAPLDPDTKAFMEAIFRLYNEKLYEKIGRDFRWGGGA
jgi:hypothetical protein